MKRSFTLLVTPMCLYIYCLRICAVDVLDYSKFYGSRGIEIMRLFSVCMSFHLVYQYQSSYWL